jgi:hypothetical protein
MAMTASYLTDLEDLLRKHLPKDSDPKMTDHVVSRWKAQLEPASVVKLEWDTGFGRKLKASWLDGGEVLASMARPEARAQSLREFVSDWEAFRRRHSLPARVVSAA